MHAFTVIWYVYLCTKCFTYAYGPVIKEPITKIMAWVNHAYGSSPSWLRIIFVSWPAAPWKQKHFTLPWPINREVCQSDEFLNNPKLNTAVLLEIWKSSRLTKDLDRTAKESQVWSLWRAVTAKNRALVKGMFGFIGLDTILLLFLMLFVCVFNHFIVFKWCVVFFKYVPRRYVAVETEREIELFNIFEQDNEPSIPPRLHRLNVRCKKCNR